MKELSRLQTIIYFVGGILMIAGAVLFLYDPLILAPTLFSIGALAYVSMQWMQKYEGEKFILKRLRKLQLLSGWIIIFSAILMVCNRWTYDIFTLLKVDIYNMWIVFLFVGVLLQFYTILRMDKEIKLQ